MNDNQKDIDLFFKKAGWEYWTVPEIMLRLMEEVGELSREINKKYGSKKTKKGELDKKIEDELGDILYTLACLANTENINLDNALKKSIEKVIQRDWKK